MGVCGKGLIMSLVTDFQLQQEEDPALELTSSVLTLRRLAVWMYEPLLRLKTLAALVDICQGMECLSSLCT